MRLGVLLVPTDPWSTTVATAKNLERMGYHHLWVYDHLSWQRYRDRAWHATYPWITGLAAATSRIRFGTMVSNPNIRHPLLLAKDAMTIDHISNGRLTIGIGAGGTGFDATVIGQEPLTPSVRIDRLEEFAYLLDKLLRGELHDYDGDHYRINEARMLPGCVQAPRVPLAIAAGRPRSLRLVADRADGWITYGDTSYSDLSETGTERVVVDQLAHIEDRCAQIGRDAEEIDRIYLVGNTEAKPLSSIEAFTDFAGRYAALGFTDLVFHHPRAARSGTRQATSSKPSLPRISTSPTARDQVAVVRRSVDSTTGPLSHRRTPSRVAAHHDPPANSRRQRRNGTSFQIEVISSVSAG